MKDFALLFRSLEETTSTNRKISALISFYESAPRDEISYAVLYLTGNKPKRMVSSALMRSWAAEEAGIAEWLFEECYQMVGDLSETLSLIIPDSGKSGLFRMGEIVGKVFPLLTAADEATKKEIVKDIWRNMSVNERFLFNKMIGGSFRVGVSSQIVITSLSRYSGLPESVIAHRLMGKITPSADFIDVLLAEETTRDISRPYPFALAYPLGNEPEELGEPGEWQAEWKWDGIRAQLVKREGGVFLWSRGMELINDSFPDIISAAAELPEGTVLDGELLVMLDGKVLPFNSLQQRIGKKSPGKKLISANPVSLMAYDIPEYDTADIRDLPVSERRIKLKQIISGIKCDDNRILLSPVLDFSSWSELREIRRGSREMGVEGLMLKRKSSPYFDGRKRGDWWKWKVDPLTVDCVLLYAQPGHGRRAGLFTDYTFAVWDNGKLVPFAKAYSGLTDKEINEVDRFVKANTTERFGPVRSVTPKLVFELAFEGLQLSTRHKSGIAVRFPRISRWRRDLDIKDADDLQKLKEYLKAISPGDSDARS